MSKRNQNVFPIVAGLTALAIIGVSFGVLLWIAQRVGPSGAISANNVDAIKDSSTASRLDSIEATESIPAGLYTYGGSTTVAPIRQLIEPMIQETLPEFQLRYTNPVNKAPSSSTGIDMLLNGQLSFAEASRSIKPDEHEAARQLGFELKQIPIAIDGIAIALNPDLELEGLTIEQLGDIYRGKITNWSEVGGPDLDIQSFSKLPSTSGTAAFFVESVLNGDELDSRVEIVDETTVVLREMATTPGSIFYVSAPEVVSQCSVKTLPISSSEETPFVSPYQPPFVNLSNCPEQRNQINREAFRDGTYPLTRRLFVIVKKDGSVDEAAGRSYSNILLSPEGQAQIEQAGFVSIR